MAKKKLDLSIVEKKLSDIGYNSLVIALENGKLVLRKFNPGKGISEPIVLLEGNKHCFTISSVAALSLANQSGIDPDRLADCVTSLTEEEEVFTEEEIEEAEEEVEDELDEEEEGEEEEEEEEEA